MFQALGFQPDAFQFGPFAAATETLTPHEMLRAALGDLVGLRYYPTKFPQETGAPTWPAIRGTIVSRDNAADQCGAGDLDEDDIRVQLDFCGTTYNAVNTLFAAACAALAAADPVWIRQPGSFDTWDFEAKVHRFSADFVLYQSTPD